MWVATAQRFRPPPAPRVSEPGSMGRRIRMAVVRMTAAATCLELLGSDTVSCITDSLVKTAQIHTSCPAGAQSCKPPDAHLRSDSRECPAIF